MRRKIAFVVQRYGKEVMGGSELHCRLVAERLAAAGHDVTVYTTTRQGLHHLEERIPGRGDHPQRRRHPAIPGRESRGTSSPSTNFRTGSSTIPTRRTTSGSGWNGRGRIRPASSRPSRARRRSHDLFIFFTYLYYNTYWGLKAVPREKTVLVPTAHDEPALRLEIMKEVFARPRGLRLQHRVREGDARPLFFLRGQVRGRRRRRGRPPGGAARPPGFFAEYRVRTPYILYAGRIEPGKGCRELLDNFLRYVRTPPGLDLLLIGNLLMHAPRRIPPIQYLGFVSPEDKNAAMAGAVATIHPSHFESLCMAALESLAVRTPILVQEATDPLKQHCLEGTVRPVLLEPGRVRRGPGPPRGGRTAAPGPRRERLRLRGPQLRLADDHRKVREDVRAYARARLRGRSPELT